MPSFSSLMIQRMVGDTSSFIIGYWEKEDEPGIMWAKNRTILRFALPRVGPMCSPSCLKACGHFALPAIVFWFELGLNLPQRSDAWRASRWAFCFLASRFSWERNKSTQLSARFLWLPCPHWAAAASGTNKPIGIPTSLLALCFPTLFSLHFSLSVL